MCAVETDEDEMDWVGLYTLCMDLYHVKGRRPPTGHVTVQGCGFIGGGGGAASVQY